jgi:aminomethyltransferase
MGSRTPLFDAHVAAGAKIVPFGGWDMPLHYGSQIEEHHAVRRSRRGVRRLAHAAGRHRGRRMRGLIFDLLANDVGKLQAPGKALYSCMLNERGGVVDDLILIFADRTATARWSTPPRRIRTRLDANAGRGVRRSVTRAPR